MWAARWPPCSVIVVSVDRRGPAMTLSFRAPSPAGWAGSVARVARVRKPRGVPGHGIDLEVDAVAGLGGAPGRDGERVRDHHHRERVALDNVDGERGSVERHGALFGDELRQVVRRTEDE